MNRLQKSEFIEDFKEEINNATTLVIVHYQGLSVAESTELRNIVRNNGSKIKITKNKLTKIALQDTQFENVSELLTGPTAICYGEDPVGTCKAIAKFANDNDKLKIIGGGYEGNLLSIADIDDLSKLPSIDELRGKIVGLLSAPAGKVASVLQAPAGQLARVFSAYGAVEK